MSRFVRGMSTAFKNLLTCLVTRKCGTSKVLSLLTKEDQLIAFLQETHFEDKDNTKLQRNWVGQVFATSYSSLSRGEAILMSKNLAFLSLECIKDNQGLYVIVKGILAGKKVIFLNLYCPLSCSPDFLSKTFAVFMNHASGGRRL